MDPGNKSRDDEKTLGKRRDGTTRFLHVRPCLLLPDLS